MSYKKPCKIWTSGVSYFRPKFVQFSFLKNGPYFDGRFLKSAKILMVVSYFCDFFSQLLCRLTESRSFCTKSLAFISFEARIKWSGKLYKIIINHSRVQWEIFVTCFCQPFLSKKFQLVHLKVPFLKILKKTKGRFLFFQEFRLVAKSFLINRFL